MITVFNTVDMVDICVLLHGQGVKFEANRVNGQWEITLT